jgi:mycobactin polyketide synthetase MbtD
VHTKSLPDGRVPVLLSAHSEELIADDAKAIVRYLDREPDVHAVAAMLVRTRKQRRHRAVVRAADARELADGLRALTVGEEHPLVAQSSESAAPRTAFVFPGQGNQWPSMGTDAYRQLRVYRAEADKCADAFVAAGVGSPLAYLVGDTGEGSQILTQAAQFTHAAGLAQVWRAYGIVPEFTVGHSLGEVAAAYTAGSITVADAAAVVIARAKVVDELPGRYGMTVLGVCPADAEQLIAKASGWLELSVVNCETSVVVSGDRDAIATIVAAAEQQDLFARDIAVDFPAHTSALDGLHSALLALLPHGRFSDADVQFIGSATGDVVEAGTDFADYWYRNLRNTVRFDRAAAAALRRGARTFVELSAHPALLFALGDLSGDGADEPRLAVGSGRRDEPLVDVLSTNIVAAAVADPSYRWADFVDVQRPLLRHFPNAPMRAEHLWATPEPLPPVPGLIVADEKWELSDKSDKARISVRSVAVLDLAEPCGALADQLRSAVTQHPGVQQAQARDADMIVAIAPVLDHPDVELAAEEISRLIGSGLYDYVDAIGANCRDVWLVTVGGEHVRADEPVALPAQTALAAMHRSVGFEHPDQTFRHLDLQSWEVDDVTAAAVIDTLLDDATEAALRDDASGPIRLVRALPDAVHTPAPWQLEGLLDNVVITGGSGTVGLHYARYVAERGARRIVLLSRGGVDSATVAELAGAHGAEVLAPQCDLTSAEQVRAAAEFAGDGASLVVHTAGTATFAARDELTPAAFADTAAAKIGGLARLAELWPLRPDARILVCSSVSGVWGGRGHAAYSAANRLLDVMAGQLRADGRHCVAVRWGLWEASPGKSGIAVADEVAQIERSGLRPMAPEIAIEASLREHRSDPLILAADRDRLRTFFETREARGAESDTTATEIDIAALVRAELAAALNLGDAAVDLDTSLLDLGVDSLLALDLRKRLRKATGKSVPLAALLGGITGGELIASLDDTERSEKVETTRD